MIELSGGENTNDILSSFIKYKIDEETTEFAFEIFENFKCHSVDYHFNTKTK